MITRFQDVYIPPSSALSSTSQSLPSFLSHFTHTLSHTHTHSLFLSHTPVLPHPGFISQPPPPILPGNMLQNQCYVTSSEGQGYHLMEKNLGDKISQDSGMASRNSNDLFKAITWHSITRRWPLGDKLDMTIAGQECTHVHRINH